MDRSECPQKSRSVISQSSVLAASTSRVPESTPSVGGQPSQVPTATPSEILDIPDEALIGKTEQFDNKVILGFEAERSYTRAQEWVRAFNQLNPLKIKLTVIDELPNALFVVQFDSPNLQAT